MKIFLSSVQINFVPEPKQKPIATGLYITNVTLEDRGTYQCRAMQMIANYADMLSKTIQLKVFREFFIFYC